MAQAALLSQPSTPVFLPVILLLDCSSTSFSCAFIDAHKKNGVMVLHLCLPPRHSPVHHNSRDAPRVRCSCLLPSGTHHTCIQKLPHSLRGSSQVSWQTANLLLLLPFPSGTKTPPPLPPSTVVTCMYPSSFVPITQPYHTQERESTQQPKHCERQEGDGREREGRWYPKISLYNSSVCTGY